MNTLNTLMNKTPEQRKRTIQQMKYDSLTSKGNKRFKSTSNPVKQTMTFK